MTLGEVIHSYRTEHNINMQDFANQCGLSKAYISILERNFNPSSGRPPIPSLETIRAISKAICANFNDIIAILDGEQLVSLESTSEYPSEKDIFSEIEVELVHAYRKASPDDKQIVDLTLKKYMDKPCVTEAPSKSKLA